MTLSWSVKIDWENNGTFVEESSRLLAVTTRRGRNRKFSSTGQQAIENGSFVVVFDNNDRRYDPYYASGALYGYLRPGRQIIASVTEDGITYPVFRGYLSDIRPDGASNSVRISAVDGLFFLNRQNCSTLSTQTNILISAALDDLLNMSSWPLISSAAVFPFTLPLILGNAAIDNNGDTIDSFTPDTSKTILAVMNEIAEAFGGTIFVTVSGSLAYRARDTVLGIMATIDQSELMTEIEPQMPWDSIFNDIRITPTVGSVQIEADSTSAAEFGPSTFTITSNAMIQSEAQAADLAAHLIRYMPEYKVGLRVRLKERAGYQFGVELLDKIKITADYLGIDNLYQVGCIEHSYQAGYACVTTLTLEPDFLEIAGIQTFPFTFPLVLGW